MDGRHVRAVPVRIDTDRPNGLTQTNRETDRTARAAFCRPLISVPSVTPFPLWDPFPPSPPDYQMNRSPSSAWRPAAARDAAPKVVASALVWIPDRFAALKTLKTCARASTRWRP